MRKEETFEMLEGFESVLYFFFFANEIITFRRDYERFSLEAPAFSGHEELEKDLTECEEIWGLYEKFDQGNFFFNRKRAFSGKIDLIDISTVFLRSAGVLHRRMDNLSE